MNTTKYDWKLIQEAYDNGLTWRELTEKFNCSNGTLVDAKKRGYFTTRSKSEAAIKRKRSSRPRLPKYDWTVIQAAHDNGLTWRQLTNDFGCSASTLYYAVKRGDLVPRTKSEAMRGKKRNPLSENHKQKISNSRRKWLENNPDKVPYLINHSSKESYPEKIFRNALTAAELDGWTQNYQHGIYQYDFAFVDAKLDIEIDGGTHTLEKVKRIDARRDEWSISQGWKVLRFPAKRVKEDVVSCINQVKQVLGLMA